MVLLALLIPFFYHLVLFSRKVKKFNINLQNIAVVYSYPYLTCSKAEVSRLHGIDPCTDTEEVLTGNFSLRFLIHLSICSCASSNISDSEPGCLSESPMEHFQSIYIIPKGAKFGEGVEKGGLKTLHVGLNALSP